MKQLRKSLLVFTLTLVGGVGGVSQTVFAQGDDLHDWQDWAATLLGGPLAGDIVAQLPAEEHVRRNESITARYGELYAQSADRRLLWLGLAGLSSQLVGDNMQRLLDEATRRPWLLPLYRAIVRELGRGNSAVFAFSYPLHLAYHSRGLALLGAWHEQNVLPELAYQAFVQLERSTAKAPDAVPDIYEMEYILQLSREEQEQVLQPLIFDSLLARTSGHLLSQTVTSPIPGGVGFYEARGPLANVASLSERWAWFLSAVFPDWIGHIRGRTRQGQSPYEAMEACVKADYLWHAYIKPNRYGTLPPIRGAGFLDYLAALRTGFSLGETFTHSADFMPQGRRKILHPQGSIARVVYRSYDNHPYTGLYAAAETCGLLRLSLIGSPAQVGRIAPGLALKLFVDHAPAAHVHLMPSPDEQAMNPNIFALDYRNHVAPTDDPTVLALEWALRAMGFELRSLKVDQPAQRTIDGAAIAAPQAPWELAFRAPDPHGFSDTTDTDFRAKLAEIAPGTVLFEVLAKDSENAPFEPIGEVVTTSAFLASRFADENLFFRHNPSP